MKTMLPAVKIAFDHVRSIYPIVSMVVFNREGRWIYTNDDFDIPTFDDRIDVGILEDACDSVADSVGFPAVFAYP